MATTFWRRISILLFITYIKQVRNTRSRDPVVPCCIVSFHDCLFYFSELSFFVSLVHCINIILFTFFVFIIDFTSLALLIYGMASFTFGVSCSTSDTRCVRSVVGNWIRGTIFRSFKLFPFLLVTIKTFHIIRITCLLDLFFFICWYMYIDIPCAVM